MNDAPDDTRLTKIVSDLTGMGQLGEALLAALTKGLGAATAPWQTRRIGQADTDVAVDRIIRTADAQAVAQAIASGELTLKERAGARLVARETQKQINLETIADKSITLLAQDPEFQSQTADTPDPDWMDAFFSFADGCSNDRIQSIWARILAAQVSPKRRAVSLATLDSLRLLEPHQAQAFENLIRPWATLGSLLDISLGDPPDPNFTIYSQDHLALQGLGLVEIVHRQQNYIQGNGWMIGFIKPAVSPITQPDTPTIPHHFEFSHIRPSWRGLELCDALYPGLLDWAHDRTDISVDMREWAAPTLRACVISDWINTFVSSNCTILIGRYGRAEPLDDGARLRSHAIYTHCRAQNQPWAPIAETSDDFAKACAKYPPEIQIMLSLTEKQHT